MSTKEERAAKKAARAVEYAAWSASRAEEAARARAAQEERARLAKLPRAFRCINGGLLEVPVYEGHHRAKNWAAIVEVDPARPGGFERTWFERGNGPCFYIVPKVLAVGHIVEFGADYVTGVGKRKPLRWFGVVREVTASHILLQPYEDVVTALLAKAG